MPKISIGSNARSFIEHTLEEAGLTNEEAEKFVSKIDGLSGSVEELKGKIAEDLVEEGLSEDAAADAADAIIFCLFAEA